LENRRLQENNKMKKVTFDLKDNNEQQNENILIENNTKKKITNVNEIFGKEEADTVLVTKSIDNVRPRVIKRESKIKSAEVKVVTPKLLLHNKTVGSNIMSQAHPAESQDTKPYITKTTSDNLDRATKINEYLRETNFNIEKIDKAVNQKRNYSNLQYLDESTYLQMFGNAIQHIDDLKLTDTRTAIYSLNAFDMFSSLLPRQNKSLREIHPVCELPSKVPSLQTSLSVIRSRYCSFIKYSNLVGANLCIPVNVEIGVPVIGDIYDGNWGDLLRKNVNIPIFIPLEKKPNYIETKLVSYANKAKKHIQPRIMDALNNTDMTAALKAMGFHAERDNVDVQRSMHTLFGEHLSSVGVNDDTSLRILKMLLYVIQAVVIPHNRNAIVDQVINGVPHIDTANSKTLIDVYNTMIEHQHAVIYTSKPFDAEYNTFLGLSTLEYPATRLFYNDDIDGNLTSQAANVHIIGENNNANIKYMYDRGTRVNYNFNDFSFMTNQRKLLSFTFQYARDKIELSKINELYLMALSLCATPLQKVSMYVNKVNWSGDLITRIFAHESIPSEISVPCHEDYYSMKIMQKTFDQLLCMMVEHVTHFERNDRLQMIMRVVTDTKNTDSGIVFQNLCSLIAKAFVQKRVVSSDEYHNYVMQLDTNNIDVTLIMLTLREVLPGSALTALFKCFSYFKNTSLHVEDDIQHTMRLLNDGDDYMMPEWLRNMETCVNAYHVKHGELDTTKCLTRRYHNGDKPESEFREILVGDVTNKKYNNNNKNMRNNNKNNDGGNNKNSLPDEESKGVSNKDNNSDDERAEFEDKLNKGYYDDVIEEVNTTTVNKKGKPIERYERVELGNIRTLEKVANKYDVFTKVSNTKKTNKINLKKRFDDINNAKIKVKNNNPFEDLKDKDKNKPPHVSTNEKLNDIFHRARLTRFFRLSELKDIDYDTCINFTIADASTYNECINCTKNNIPHDDADNKLKYLADSIHCGKYSTNVTPSNNIQGACNNYIYLSFAYSGMGNKINTKSSYYVNDVGTFALYVGSVLAKLSYYLEACRRLKYYNPIPITFNNLSSLPDTFFTDALTVLFNVKSYLMCSKFMIILPDGIANDNPIFDMKPQIYPFPSGNALKTAKKDVKDGDEVLIYKGKMYIYSNISRAAADAYTMVINDGDIFGGHTYKFERKITSVNIPYEVYGRIDSSIKEYMAKDVIGYRIPGMSRNAMLSYIQGLTILTQSTIETEIEIAKVSARQFGIDNHKVLRYLSINSGVTKISDIKLLYDIDENNMNYEPTSMQDCEQFKIDIHSHDVEVADNAYIPAVREYNINMAVNNEAQSSDSPAYT